MRKPTQPGRQVYGTTFSGLNFFPFTFLLLSLNCLIILSLVLSPFLFDFDLILTFTFIIIIITYKNTLILFFPFCANFTMKYTLPRVRTKMICIIIHTYTH